MVNNCLLKHLQWMERKENMAKTMDEDFCNNNNNNDTKAIEDINNVDPLMNKVKAYKVYSPLLRQVNLGT